MLFNSYIFVFLFFPLVVAGYYVLHHFGWRKAALGYLTMMSMVFYGYNSMAYLVMLVVSILVNFFLVRCMGSDSGHMWRRRAVLLLGLLYLKTNSVFCCMIVHSGYNLISYVVMIYPQTR